MKLDNQGANIKKMHKILDEVHIKVLNKNHEFLMNIPLEILKELNEYELTSSEKITSYTIVSIDLYVYTLSAILMSFRPNSDIADVWEGVEYITKRLKNIIEARLALEKNED